MSRSFRKNPICGWSNAPSDKKYKQFCNRRLRSKNKIRLKEEYEIFLEPNDVLSQSSMPKDGKNFFNKKFFPHLMRK